MGKNMGLSGRLAKLFIKSKLTPLLVVASLLLGIFAVMNTPKEEEPQISVPMVDVFIPYPGATAQDVEDRVTKPIEKKLWEVDGVEYVYSTTSPGIAMVTARFKVGSNLDQSLVRLYNKLISNQDQFPPGVLQPLVKPKTVDDVPILSLTVWSGKQDDYALRRMTAVIADEISKIQNVSKVQLIGGKQRQVRVQLDPNKLSAYGISPLSLAETLKHSNVSLPAGEFAHNNEQFKVQAGTYLADADEVTNLVVGVYQNRPVFLKDVTNIIDGPAETDNYVLFGTGQQAPKKGITQPAGSMFPAVTIAVSKKPGTNAVWIANDVERKVQDLKGKVIPDDVQVTITRDYGATAAEKSNELIEHLLIATVSVILLIGVVLGIRESFVVGIAVPVTLALALFLSYMYGYTLNRVTLFALIFAIGILVDDAIVVVENIHRWFTVGKLPPWEAAVRAVDEVGNPTILATFTVIATLMPMAFVGGMMGPYMSPIPINASVAMFFSLLVAFIVTPWFALRFLKKSVPHGASFVSNEAGKQSRWVVGYIRTISKLLHNRKKRYLFVFGVTGLMLVSMLFFYTKAVPMKMMPFDNKSEFQVVVDMPEGSTLEKTAAATKAIGEYLSTVNEVSDYQIYVGTASPFNFNGLVRHYFLRDKANQADIQVNLVDKKERKQQSHEIAKRIRPEVQKIGSAYGANVKVVEVPPGPPVMSTIVLEIYGNDRQQQMAAAQQAEQIFKDTKGVVDVDTSIESQQTEYRFVINEKARLNGITDQQVVQTLQTMLDGTEVGLLHPPNELEPVVIKLQPPRDKRSSLTDLQNIQIPTPTGKLIPLREIATIKQGAAEQTLYRKNLQPVVYVFGDVAGGTESPAYSMADMWNRIANIKTANGVKVEQYLTHQPWLENGVKMKWDGEWQITYEVFRDLGAAFAVAMVVMYLLIVGWFQSFIKPLVIMSPIPLTLIGVIPGHWIFGAFFTATSMIGVIALAGIIVRNSILLVEFSIRRREEGATLAEAVMEAGVVRAKPIVLTAAAVVAGSFVILFDPIFQGLAISMMFGTVAATGLTLFVVPVLFYAVESRRERRGAKREAVAEVSRSGPDLGA
ncbi:efflux RND transporter permease subunit [Effusibacillus dendaii]|uniref:Multidrug transporter AcrB n=1 Tax=Effusibacillus dendaii TaxID=2743772 RepID=A0A7I8DDZ4_9BACL|nr:efflux RND transporter permease subunit [Effusibacillus dendaii]BCJ88334.1 multidrug transporter AcrB [Effusibacillus dendaii]